MEISIEDGRIVASVSEDEIGGVLRSNGFPEEEIQDLLSSGKAHHNVVKTLELLTHRWDEHFLEHLGKEENG